MGREDAVDRVTAAARRRGLAIAIREYPAGTKTAADAAAAVGCDVAAIAKTIVLHDEVGPLIVLTSGRNRVDVAKVAAALAGGPVRRATPDEARAATGYAIGGTAPFGHPAPVRMLMDPDLLAFDEVWAAGGTPRAVFPIAPRVLADITGAIVTPVAEAQPVTPPAGTPPRDDRG